ncbi:molybdopterin oxidoreductase [Bacillus canaveralius]|uniref:Molybdopterin oxidoreductase n=1 Tax=Bacillus canaveralius TaxID=1403243 RepID=A0A2N5GQ17_9BACI|nr:MULTISPECIES: NrfD/PsrC family molybdoenzyme membrane anchor subunit [Bacillus]PLR83658.1 molybdopterin oxidoreductase [Bacillus sp. V33-4]PLR84919.1 molybdopterin oxidoreductase [Bacillus canaveralius]PLR95821.1 molybdopterin oxidoreductase [Bacillus canaveralius]
MANLAVKTNTQARTSSAFKIWVSCLFVAFAAGGYFIVDRFITGLSATNLSSITPWGAWIAFYIFFVGLSAGSFLLSTLIYVFNMEEYERIGKAALFTAIVCMIVALTFVLMDLGRPDRMLNAIIYWNVTSPLAWEVHFYLVYIALLSVELYIAMREDLVRLTKTSSIKGKVARWLTFKNATIDELTKKRDHMWMKILGTVGIPIAIFGVHGGTGTIFALVKARPGWNTALFPIIFVVSAMVSGTALLLAMYVIKKKINKQSIDKNMVQSLAKLMVAFLIIDLGLQFYEYLTSWYSLEKEHIDTLATMMTGSLSWSFRGVQMFLGAIIPIAIVFWKKTRDSVNALLLAAILIVIGIIGVRFNIVVPPLIVPVFHELPWGNYFPTINEWMVSVGVVAMGLLIYSFGEKFLPIEETASNSKEVINNGR